MSAYTYYCVVEVADAMDSMVLAYKLSTSKLLRYLMVKGSVALCAFTKPQSRVALHRHLERVVGAPCHTMTQFFDVDFNEMKAWVREHHSRDRLVESGKAPFDDNE